MLQSKREGRLKTSKTRRALENHGSLQREAPEPRGRKHGAVSVVPTARSFFL